MKLCGFRWRQYGELHSCEELPGHPGLHTSYAGDLFAFAFSGQPEGTETLHFRKDVLPKGPQVDDL